MSFNVLDCISTGRTTRMLKAAAAAASQGREVVVCAASMADVAWLKDSFVELIGEDMGVRFLSVSGPSRFDWENMRIIGTSPEAKFFVDHGAIEQRLLKALEELHRYDEAVDDIASRESTACLVEVAEGLERTAKELRQRAGAALKKKEADCKPQSTGIVSLQQIEIACNFWAHALLHPTYDNGDESGVAAWFYAIGLQGRAEFTVDQARLFAEKLCGVIGEENGPVASLSVDYNPCPLLSRALDAAYLPSTSSVLPCKTNMVFINGEVKVSSGYGTPYVTIGPDAITDYFTVDLK